MTGRPDPRRPPGLNELIPGLRSMLGRFPAARNTPPEERPAPWAGLDGLLLYILPLPLLPGAIVELAVGRMDAFLADGIGFALLMAGGWLTRRGIRAARVEQQVRFARLQRWPLKTLGGALTVIGAGTVAHFSVGHGIPISLAYAGVAALGFHLAYGFEPLGRARPFDLGDERARQVADALGEAEARLLEVERAAAAMTNPELKARVRRVSAQGREILNQIAERPTDLFRARKFLNVYLEGVQQVAEGYARTHRKADSQELEQNFRNVLVTVEEVFEEQRQKLVRTDLLDLDVQIEVLKKQLQREGIA
jgi:5-bromo-4-chloroindolyl phosphate hydrolysis protein